VPGKTDPVLVEAAIKTVRQWRFNPATNAEGHPRTAWAKVPIRFDLGNYKNKTKEK